VGICEAHSLGSDPVHVGCWYAAVGVEDLDVAVAHVVRDDEHNFRTAWFSVLFWHAISHYTGLIVVNPNRESGEWLNNRTS
jgi:hypothetical protein